MPTTCAKIKSLVPRVSFLRLSILLAGWPMILVAQNPAPAAPGPATPPAAAPAAPGAPAPATPPGAPATINNGTTDGLGQSTSTTLDYLFNHRAADNSVAAGYFQGKQEAQIRAMARDAAGDKMVDVQMQTRFIKFLGMPEVSSDQLKAYNQTIKATHDALANKKTFEAWQDLMKLASYTSLDAGISEELANRVSTIWDAGKTTNALEAQNAAYQENLDASNRSADVMAKEVQKEQIDFAKAMKGIGNKGENQQPSNTGGTGGSNSTPGTSGGGGSSASSTTTNQLPSLPSVDAETVLPQNVNPFENKMQLTQEFMNALEDKARMKINELKAQRVLDSTKNDFAAYIADLNGRKMYRNVQMAADFYRSLFDEGDYPVAVAKEVNTALAANRDVQNGVDVFKDKISSNDVAQATDQLEAAFMIDEFHPALLAIPREMKRRVEKFVIDIRKMETMIEARDFGSLEPLLAEMKGLAPDFDSTKADGMVNMAKMASGMHLNKAKMYAQSKDPGAMDKAMQEFEDATTSWPKNPDLKTVSDLYFKSMDTANQSMVEFDRLVSDQNYRQLFEKQYLFGPVVKDDSKRMDQLKDAIGKVKNAEIAIEKASSMQRVGDVAGAWETIELAVKDLPNDIKLNNMRGDLAGHAAEFVSAINKAQDAEAAGNLGYSLSWWAAAQRRYPPSSLANQAIQRISKQILDKASI